MSSELVELHVKEMLSRYGVHPGDVVVVAVSGGADSVALLRAVAAMPLHLIVAHVNYGLRGTQSDGDEAYVADLVTTLHTRCELHVLRPDVAARMKADGSSMEMACRDIRYEWFEALMREHGAKAILVAHHRDDNVETVLLNMLRGTGLRGMCGMQPFREPGILRPLLGLTRTQIEEYLLASGVSWRTDSTNAENTPLRNRIRNVVMPAIRGCFPDADTRISDTVSHLNDYHGFFTEQAQLLKVRYFAHDAYDIGRLAAEQCYARLLLHYWLEGAGVTDAMITDMLERPSRIEPVRFGGYTLHRGKLYKNAAMNVECVTWAELAEGPWKLTVLDAKELRPSGSRSEAWFDSNILDDNPRWEWRPWQSGDRFRPFGMGGRSRLVKDLLNGLHLDPISRAAVKVLVRDGEIVWIPGYANTEMFRVSRTTQRIVHLELEP